MHRLYQLFSITCIIMVCFFQLALNKPNQSILYPIHLISNSHSMNLSSFISSKRAILLFADAMLSVSLYVDLHCILHVVWHWSLALLSFPHSFYIRKECHENLLLHLVPLLWRLLLGFNLVRLVSSAQVAEDLQGKWVQDCSKDGAFRAPLPGPFRCRWYLFICGLLGWVIRMRLYTKADIKALLLSNDRAVERAILAIYARQTNEEQSSQETIHSNGIGFSGAHANLGSYYANWLKSGRHLTGIHLEKARKIASHYVGQLAEIAKERHAP